MAKQSGALPLRGTIGNITFRKTKDGDIAQAKSKLTKERVLNDAEFENSRGSSHEFGSASTGAKKLRRIFSKAILNCTDDAVHGRLLKRLQKVIFEDRVSVHGERNLLSGDIRLLRDFWWNVNEGIDNAIRGGYTIKVDRTVGEVSFAILPFIPKQMLKANPTATHYRICASAAEVDWRENAPLAEMHTTDYLPLDNKETVAFNPVLMVREGSVLPIVSCLSISWYQKVAGEMNVMRDKKFNTAGVVDVDTP